MVAISDGLSMIATKLGNPIMLDSYTSSLCMKSWGRGSFARSLIVLDATYGLNDMLVVVIPKLEGACYTTETIRVKYEWKPYRCDECKIFGHLCDNFLLKPSTSTTLPKDKEPKDQDGGPVVRPSLDNGKAKSKKDEANTPVSNLFSMNDLVDDIRKRVRAPSRKTDIWSGRKANSPKRRVVSEEMEHENISSENG
ncbi:hypothetical protein Tco_0540684 [Tanacetum coccineum]